MKGSFALTLWVALLLLSTSVTRAQWTQSGSNIYYNAGNVGIGTSSPAYLLHVETSLSSRAIFGKQSAATGAVYGGWFETASTSGMGVYGLATAATGYTYGVYGRSLSTSGKGIMGHAAATSGATYGMYGLSDSTAGMGVYGWATASSGNTIGAVGRAASTSGIGVKGFVTATSGTNYGGWFESASTGGTGVYGKAGATSGYTAGVVGLSESTLGTGVLGVARATSGETYGVYGQSNSTDGYGGYFVGRVGINYDSTATNATLRLHEIGNDGPRIEFTNSANTARKWHIWGYIGSAAGDDRLNFWNSQTGDLLSISGSGKVGIGTTNPQHTLHVQTGTVGSHAIFGHHTATSGTSYGVVGQSDSPGGAGVYGVATATGGYTYGGRFVSDSTGGRGVIGYARATSGETYGVYGRSDSTSGTGVYGRAPYRGVFGYATYGVYGQSDNTDGRGVSGLAAATSGYTCGVYGESASPSGTAVFGWATAYSGQTYGGRFQSNSPDGMGVYGRAPTIGVYGEVTAPIGTTYGVYGRSDYDQGIGVYGYTVTGCGVYGIATTDNHLAFGVYGQCPSNLGYAVYANGRFTVSGTKSFQMDHPLSPETHYLNHFCTEGPEPYNLYRGTVMLDTRGEAWVQLPDYFESINRDPSYHLTPIGAPMPNLHVAVEIQGNRFKIAGGVPGKKASWEVKAIRNDLWVQRYGYQTEQEKPKEHQGKYLNPELYGQPKEMGIHYHPEPEQPREVTPPAPEKR